MSAQIAALRDAVSGIPVVNGGDTYKTPKLRTAINVIFLALFILRSLMMIKGMKAKSRSIIA